MQNIVINGTQISALLDTREEYRIVSARSTYKLNLEVNLQDGEKSLWCIKGNLKVRISKEVERRIAHVDDKIKVRFCIIPCSAELVIIFRHVSHRFGFAQVRVNKTTPSLVYMITEG